MLTECDSAALEFEEAPSQRLPYAVVDPRVQVLDGRSAVVTARFDGPSGSKLIGRAWISDADGTIVAGETGEIEAGSTHEINLVISESRPQNGDLIACARVEWPLYQTKHVIKCVLRKGELIHPPEGKQC